MQRACLFLLIWVEQLSSKHVFSKLQFFALSDDFVLSQRFYRNIIMHIVLKPDIQSRVAMVYDFVLTSCYYCNPQFYFFPSWYPIASVTLNAIGPLKKAHRLQMRSSPFLFMCCGVPHVGTCDPGMPLFDQVDPKPLTLFP